MSMHRYNIAPGSDTQMGRWKRVIAFTRKARNGSRQIREVQLGHTGLNPMTARGRSAAHASPAHEIAPRDAFHFTSPL